jgi:hypothetical protein
LFVVVAHRLFRVRKSISAQTLPQKGHSDGSRTERWLPKNLELPKSKRISLFLTWLPSVVEQAHREKNHVLILAPGIADKTAIAIRAMVEQVKRGTDSLYLSGDDSISRQIEGEIFRDLVEQIDALDEQRPALSLMRGMGAFARYATRHPQEACANFYVFDNPDGWYLPTTADPESQYVGKMLFDVASRRDWGVVLIFLGSRYRIGFEYWAEMIAGSNLHEKEWTALSPMTWDIKSSPASKVRLKVEPCLQLDPQHPDKYKTPDKPEFKWVSNEEQWKRTRNSYLSHLPPDVLAQKVIPHHFITKEILIARVSLHPRDTFIHAAVVGGMLCDLPQDLITWEIITQGIDQNPLRTPLSFAVQFGHIEQVPLAACIEHYDATEAIVIASVESSRYDKAKRRLGVRRWLLKLLLSGGTSSDDLVNAGARVRVIAHEAIHSWNTIRIGNDFTPVTQRELSADETPITYWLRKYCETKRENCLDFALAEAYLSELVTSSSSEDQQASDLTAMQAGSSEDPF